LEAILFFKIFLKKCLVWIFINWIDFKWWLLGPYYEGFLIQAEFLYHRHFWFEERRQLLGLDFAERAFEQDVKYFLVKAKEEPLSIRFQLFWDATLEREQRPYYL